jgi:hypothetical protein
MTYIMAAVAAAAGTDTLSERIKSSGNWIFRTRSAPAVEIFDAAHNIKEGFRDVAIM